MFIKKHKEYFYRTSDLYMTDADDHFDIINMKGYQTESIDCFICSHILEHLHNDTKALAELHRIPKPTGWGIVMVPIMTSHDKTYEDFSKTKERDRLLHFGQQDHIRVYSKNDFIMKLRNAGFIVRQLSAIDFCKDTFLKEWYK